MLQKVMIQLALGAGIGPVLAARLYRTHVPDGLLGLGRLSAQQVATWYGLTPRQAALVKQALSDEVSYKSHQDWCEQNGVTAVSVVDPGYPELLRHVGFPPTVLWVKGSLVALNKQYACALVGSREATSYGKRAVKMLVPDLVAHGVATISGGARGIDACVHEETLKGAGCTVAVMGCGLAHTYPREHAPLFAAIVAGGGALVSPFPPHTEPKPGHFPVRNRIIAGLAQGCIVVQAAAKSGALITASCAVEENREVGAVPGAIDEPLSHGPNELLAQGARVIMDGSAAVELCGKSVLRAQKCAKNGSVGRQAISSELEHHLEYPCALEELVCLTGKTAAALQEELFELQLEGRVRQDHAGLWVRVG